MTWQLRVGAVQMRSTDDLKANLASCAELTARAADKGAQLVALPECFSFLGRGEGDKLAIAETFSEGGPVMTMLRELAIKHHVYMSAAARRRSSQATPSGPITPRSS